MSHTELHSKADFDKAIETKGKYVLIHAYSGSVSDKADDGNCDFYAVDVVKDPEVMGYFGISETPAAMLYKDGAQVKKIQGKTLEGIEEVAKLLS